MPMEFFVRYAAQMNEKFGLGHSNIHQRYDTSKVETHSKSVPFCSQIAVVASKLAVANCLPDGDQEHDRTVRVCLSSNTAYTQFNDLVVDLWNDKFKFGNRDRDSHQQADSRIDLIIS
ncbi:hypothetical protein LXL04_018341 [Taraxacum kok-saghyz]